MKIKSIITRWLMRIQQSSRILKLFYWFITAASALGIFVKGSLTTIQTIFAILMLILGTIIFAYYYEREEVMKDQFKEQRWRKANFADPRLKMQFVFRKEMFKILSLYLEGEADLEEFDSKTNELVEKFQKKGIERGNI